MSRLPGIRAFVAVGTLAAAGVLGACSEAPDASAQGAPAAQQGAPPQAAADTFQLVFEREVFSYPSFQRRNPFAPITAETAGPRFEDLELQMVIVFEDGGGSVATLAVRGGQQRAGARSYRVREGDVLGNVRVVAIRLREIVVDVDEFGGRERRVLELRRSEPEARVDDAAPDTVPPPDTTGVAPDPILPDTTVSIPGDRNGGSE
jgi:hypothetical protein